MRRKLTSLEICLSVISSLLSLCCIGLIVYACIVGVRDEGTEAHSRPVSWWELGCHWSVCWWCVQVRVWQSRRDWVDGWRSHREQSSQKSWRTPAVWPSNPSPSTSRTWWGHMIFFLRNNKLQPFVHIVQEVTNFSNDILPCHLITALPLIGPQVSEAFSHSQTFKSCQVSSFT